MPIRLLYLDTSADETLVSWMEMVRGGRAGNAR